MADLLSFVRGLDLTSVRFTDIVLDNNYKVPYRVLAECERSLAILVHLEAGWCFKPGAHSYPVEILVLDGIGMFYRDGTTSRYEPGAKIFLAPGMEHAFSCVEERTLFIKNATFRTAH